MDTSEMSEERKKAVQEETARLNARAVLQHLEDMSERLNQMNAKIERQAQRIAMLERRIEMEQNLRNALSRDNGPTV